MPSSRALARIGFAAKLGLGLAVVAILFWLIDGRRALGHIAEANVWLVALGGAVTVGQIALSALKWRILLLGRGYRVPYLVLLKSYFIGNVANLFAPTFIAGDTYRAASIRSYVGSFARSVPSVIADRATGLVALLALGSIGLGVYLAGEHYALVILAVLLAIAAGYAVLVLLVIPGLARLAQARRGRLLAFVHDVAEAFRPSPSLATAQLLAFLFQGNIILISVIYSAGLELSATAPLLVMIVPGVYLLEMLPITVAGLGVRETAFTALFAAFGLPPAEGLALGLLISAMRYVVGGIGALAFLIPVGPPGLSADGA